MNIQDINKTNINISFGRTLSSWGRIKKLIEWVRTGETNFPLNY